MDTPIDVLRIEHSVISKELSRFRACDSEIRCFYCREWSQYVYKKHFIYSAKTQEDVTMDDPEKLWAGKYQINLLNGITPSKQKERSPKLSERFEKLLETQSESSSESTLTEDIVSACALWQTLPSSLSALPPVFESLHFNSYPDAIPLADDPKEPALLLDHIIIDRQSICLPADGFPLLKNLTGDVLMSYSQPTCGHSRPESRSPADLEVERTIYNEKLAKVTKIALGDLERALDHSWRHLAEFLDKLLELEKERNALMGRRSKESVDQFVENQKMPSFQEYWEEKTVAYKKRKPNLETVDAALVGYFDKLTECATQFLNDFAIPRLEALRLLIQKLWDLVVPTIQKMADRMASHEQQDERHMENCKAVSASLRGLHPADDVDVAVKRIQSDMANRIKEFRQDIANAIQAFKEESRPSVAGRLEKATQKDFRRRLRRVENGYNSLRQYFKFEVTQKIFPEPLFCKFCLICIEALMQEGEVMEAVTIEKEVKRFLESNKDLLCQRQILLDEFEDGVQTGRRELAGVVGKLFLKEGMRIQGENLALRRQHMFLQSMSQSDQQGGSASSKKSNKNKKKKKKKKAASALINDNTSISANESSRAASACSSPTPVHQTINKDEPESTPPDSGTFQQQPRPTAASESEPASAPVPAPAPAAIAAPPPIPTLPPPKKAERAQATDDTDTKTPSNLAASANGSQISKEPEQENQATDTESEAKGVRGWTTVKKSKIARRPQNISESYLDTLESNCDATRSATSTTAEADASVQTTSPNTLSKGSTVGSRTPTISSPSYSTDLPQYPSADTNQQQQQQQQRRQQPPGLHDVIAEPVSKTITTPEELDQMSHNQLVALVFGLQRENSQLGEAVNAMRKDLGLMSRQYADAMAMARDREEQIAQLFEARRRADMEVARQQIAALEAKIVAMQQHDGLSPINCNPVPSSGVMAGFGNQDLFAGYREQMQSSHRHSNHSQKPWQKSIRVRCGNCGGLGHASAECKDACRYCGSTDHLSESCRFIA